MRDALNYIHELEKLYRQSGKFKNMYLTQRGDNAEAIQLGSLKPICPLYEICFNKLFTYT